MTALTGRTGVRIKAALSIIHKAGLDVASVERQAENAVRRGINQGQAYDRAMQGVLRNAPSVKRTVERIDRLLSKSDGPSIQQYERAIDAYVASRDESLLDALAPMMKADMQALAVRDGEVSVDDAYAGRVDWAAMGAPGFAEQAAAPAPEAPQQFSFSATPVQTGQQGVARLPPGTSASASGIRTGKAAERWERAERVTYGLAHPIAEARAD